MSESEPRKWRRATDVDTQPRSEVKIRRRSPSSSPRPSSSRYKSDRNRSDRSPRPSSSDRKKEKKKEKSKKRKKDKSKKKKSRKRDSSSDSDTEDNSDADSDSSVELLVKLEKERQELREKRKREKEKLKTFETAEEKRARRLYKKEVKARKTREEEGWDDHSYTNDANPFGDPNLTATFRWNKKLEKEGLGKADDREIDRLQRAKRNEQRLELEKVKQRRLEREREREDRAKEMELEQRQRDNEKFSKWEKDEDDFHLKQARLRSKIRIIDGRAKPIDLLAKYVSTDEDMDAVEMHEPYTYLNGLTVDDLEDLLVDINVYRDIDLDKNKDFWNDIVIIVEDELHKLRRLDSKSQYEVAAERRQGINKAVASDVQEVFKGKSATQLSELQKQIERKLKERAEGVDVGYWESLLSQLKAHLARARLRDRHSENLRKKLELLKAEQQGGDGDGEHNQSPRDEEETRRETEESVSSGDDDDDDGQEDSAAASMLDPALDEYEAGKYSPAYLSQEDLEPGSIVITEAEDLSKLNVDQSRALRGSRVDNVMSAEEKALEREARKGMNDDEATFSVETNLEHSYEWSDKYRPRKPRYFNRVHTGFEWNKYNQTHYDIDNPPPKVVQGYKFNIFYPDLIDKASTPSYTLTVCSDNKDFVILRIHAGPPYEDIAFKIVNREWEYGYKRGFRCQFQNNIFQLWFHFKRLRYRR